MIRKRDPSADSSASLLADLARIVGEDGVVAGAAGKIAYERDAYPLAKSPPLATVLPHESEQVQRLMRWCNIYRIPFAARGSGTGLAGGTVCADGLVISLTRMNRIWGIDVRNRLMKAQAGAINADLSKAVEGTGLHYAPDPSSQSACTLGGNIANNAGGPHTLKYGVTAGHILSVRLALSTGELVEIGSHTEEMCGYDLLGAVIGGEGTLGIVTEATVRLTRLPKSYRTLLATFPTLADASEAVTEIIAEGITPAALELMDSLVARTVEDAFHLGIPRDSGAILLVEIDGLPAGLPRLMQQVQDICRRRRCSEMRSAEEKEDRAALWTARKKAVGTLGRLAPSCVTQDCVIPRSCLPLALQKIEEIGRRNTLMIANVFHAGDGNLHPIVLFDERDQEQVKRVMAASEEILELCIGMGGTLTGEHGIGLEKRDFMPRLYNPATLFAMRELQEALDPSGLCNPGKVLPSSHGCSYEISSYGKAGAS